MTGKRNYATCDARKRNHTSDDDTCTRPAGWGTEHPGIGRCKLHGGRSPNANAVAREQQARQLVATYGRPIETTAAEALLSEIHWTAGHVAWLRDMVQSIDADALVWGISKEVAPAAEVLDEGGNPVEADLTAVPEVTKTAAVSVWLKLYMEERKHLVDTTTAALRIGIEERRVRLAEDQGRLLVDGLRWLFDQLSIRGEKLETANRLAVEMLRSLAAGTAPVLELEGKK